MDHDGLFKQLVKADLSGFTSLFHPDFARELEFTGHEFLDKETYTDVTGGTHRVLDLVARVCHKEEGSGERQPLLVHIEVQARRGERLKGVPLPERLYEYYNQLRQRHRIPVVSLVLYLFRARKGRCLEYYEEGAFGLTRVRFSFSSIGLPRLPAAEFLRTGTAMAGAMAALMDPGSWSRSKLKAECLRTVNRSTATEALKFLAIDCIETYLRLEPSEQQDFEALSQEERYMDYAEAMKIEKTWSEEIMEKGIEKGMRASLLKQLKLKFGALPRSVVARLETMTSPGELDILAEKVLTAGSLEEMGLQ